MMDAYFHEGELAIQEKLGAAKAAARSAASMFHASIPFEHRLFPASQKIAWIGGRDDQGRPWVTALVHREGVMAETNGPVMRLRPGCLHRALAPADAVGMLFIDPVSRKRLRINGVVQQQDANGTVILVAQCFGNCPRYIQAREVADWPTTLSPKLADTEDRISASASERLAQADTFFIATATPPDHDPRYRMHGVDVSHRGGDPGVLHVMDAHSLKWPDFPGNRLYNTLGNVSLWPSAAIVVPDYGTGHLLEVRGEVTIIDDDLPGADHRRCLHMQVREVCTVRDVLPSQWIDH